MHTARNRGRLVAHLAGRGARVLGVDLSAGMLAVAATRVPGRLVRADARRLPLPDAIADAAITIATLEFIDAAAALAELARITRPGGRIVALTLNPTGVKGVTRESLGVIEDRRPHRVVERLEPITYLHVCAMVEHRARVALGYDCKRSARVAVRGESRGVVWR